MKVKVNATIVMDIEALEADKILNILLIMQFLNLM